MSAMFSKKELELLEILNVLSWAELSMKKVL